MNLVNWCNRIIRGSFLSLFILVPLILTPWNYELFEFNKMIITYGLTVIIMATWVIKMMAEKKIVLRRTILDIPILLFVTSQLISSLFSIDPHVSWFGYYSRFNGGMLSIICYVLLYYAFVNNWTEKFNKLFYAIIGTASLVSFYGILEHFGIDKHLWVQDVQNRVFSTLGQPNWLAAYVVAVLPIGFAFALQSGKRLFNGKFLFWTCINFLLFITLLFTRSRSGLAGLAMADAIFWLGSIVLSQTKQKIILAGLITHAIFLLVIFLNGTHVDVVDKYLTMSSLTARMQAKQSQTTPVSASNQPVAGSSMLESGGTESGTIRKYVWQAALTAWRSSQKAFLIGTGTETFAFAFFQYKPTTHNLTSEWDFLYNKAHNEYLNYLATTGSFGLGSYVLLLGLFIIWFTKRFTHHHPLEQTKNPHSVTDTQQSKIMQLALFAGWISILVTNFFGFSVVIIQLCLFLFPAMIDVMGESTSRRHISLSIVRLPTSVSRTIMVISVGVATICFGFVITMWIADSTFAQGYRLSRAGQLPDAYHNLLQASLLRPQEPLYLDEMSVVLAGLSVNAMASQDVTAAATLAQQSLNASDRALSISPNNVNFWKSRTKIYFGFGNVDPKFIQAALTALEKAYTLSPTDPKIAYNLAVLHGRLGEHEKAIEILKQTIALKPNYRDAYYALYVFYLEVKQPNLAKEILQEYLKKVDPNDKDFQDKLKQ